VIVKQIHDLTGFSYPYSFKPESEEEETILRRILETLNGSFGIFEVLQLSEDEYNFVVNTRVFDIKEDKSCR
tara:strand:- start:68366 stop:68581 length:216 start_codon:yes stop_codon:yes gene_type:complete